MPEDTIIRIGDHKVSMAVKISELGALVSVTHGPQSVLGAGSRAMLLNCEQLRSLKDQLEIALTTIKF